MILKSDGKLALGRRECVIQKRECVIIEKKGRNSHKIFPLSREMETTT